MQRLNDLRAERAKNITDAEAILLLAESENRAPTAEELAKVDALIGNEEGSIPGAISELDAQIGRYVRVTTLKAELANTAPGPKPVKPDGNTQAQTMKRGDWEKLSQAARGAFIANG